MFMGDSSVSPCPLSRSFFSSSCCVDSPSAAGCPCWRGLFYLPIPTSDARPRMQASVAAASFRSSFSRGAAPVNFSRWALRGGGGFAVADRIPSLSRCSDSAAAAVRLPDLNGRIAGCWCKRPAGGGGKAAVGALPSAMGALLSPKPWPGWRWPSCSMAAGQCPRKLQQICAGWPETANTVNSAGLSEWCCRKPCLALMRHPRAGSLCQTCRSWARCLS